MRLHLGTAELMARVVLLDRDQLAPGDWAEAQVFFGRPAVTTWGQPFVIRSESPVVTIGGGRVLDPAAAKLRRHHEPTLRRLADLGSDDPTARASAALFFAGWRAWRPEYLARTAGIDDVKETCRELADRGEMLEIDVSPTRTIRIHRSVLQALCGRVEAALKKLHLEYPLQSILDRSRLASRFAYLRNDALVEALLKRMARDGRITLSERGIALAGHGPQLSAKDGELLKEIVEVYRSAGYQPPTVAQVQTQVSRRRAVVPQLIKLAAGDGRLREISADLYLDAELEQKMRTDLTQRFSDGQGLTVSQIRDILGTTRKYAVPLCEYLDRVGFTERRGNVRVLRKA